MHCVKDALESLLLTCYHCVHRNQGSEYGYNHQFPVFCADACELVLIRKLLTKLLHVLFSYDLFVAYFMNEK